MTRAKTEKGGHAKSSVRSRQQFNVPNTPGASISLPSLEGLLNWRLLSFGMVVGLCLVLYLMWTTPYFVVEQAEISGLNRIMGHDVNAVLDIGGMPSFALDSVKMQQILVEQFPEFASADVSVNFPNTVAISVTERLPVLIWKQDGRTDLIDQEGMAFPLRSEEINVDLPQVEAFGTLTGLVPVPVPTDTVKTNGLRFSLFGKPEDLPEINQAQQVLTPEAVQSILKLSEFAPQGLPLTYRDEHGFGWQDSAGWFVYFGDAQEIDLKLNIYQKILRLLDDKDVKPELISVEWVHAPYYRLEP